MDDKRPPELIQNQVDTVNINDALIVDALTKLEKDAADLKLKATVATLCKLTGLSRNTIRGRVTAMNRLKDIKTARRLKRTSLPPVSEQPGPPQSVEDELRAQLDRVVGQNALLYDEILFLHEQLGTRDREIQALKTTKLKLVDTTMKDKA